MNLTYPPNPRLRICVHGVDGSVATFTAGQTRFDEAHPRGLPEPPFLYPG